MTMIAVEANRRERQKSIAGAKTRWKCAHIARIMTIPFTSKWPAPTDSSSQIPTGGWIIAFVLPDQTLGIFTIFNSLLWNSLFEFSLDSLDSLVNTRNGKRFEMGKSDAYWFMFIANDCCLLCSHRVGVFLFSILFLLPSFLDFGRPFALNLR